MDNTVLLYLAQGICVLDMVAVEEEAKRICLILLDETVVLEESVHVNTDQYMSSKHSKLFF